MIIRVVPTRKDVIKEVKGVSEGVFNQLENENIILMPSNAALHKYGHLRKRILQTLQKMFSDQKQKRNIKIIRR